MWFIPSKINKVLKVNNTTREWLRARLDCTRVELKEILNGTRAADYEIAKGFLEVFGYDFIVEAIDWRKTKYASV